MSRSSKFKKKQQRQDKFGVGVSPAKRDISEIVLNSFEWVTSSHALFITALFGTAFCFCLSLNNQYLSYIPRSEDVDVGTLFKHYSFTPSLNGWNGWLLWDSITQPFVLMWNKLFVLWKVPTPNIEYTLTTNIGPAFAALIATVISLALQSLLTRSASQTATRSLSQKRILAMRYNQESRMEANENAIDISKFYVNEVNRHGIQGFILTGCLALAGVIFEMWTYIKNVPKNEGSFYLFFPGMDIPHWGECLAIIVGVELFLFLALFSYADHKSKKQLNQAMNTPPVVI